MARTEGCTTNSCGELQQDFFHLLAAALVIDSTGCIRLRVHLTLEECDAVDQYIDCANAHVDPLELLKNTFGIDSCGRVILNLSIDSSDLSPQ